MKQIQSNRVVVTGIGVVSPLGLGWQDFKDSVTTGQSAIARGEFSFEDLPELSAPVGRVQGFDPAERLPNSKAATLDRFAAFALDAARQAVGSAGLSGAEIDEISIGACSGGLETLEASYAKLADGNTRVAPTTIPKFMSSAPASAISIDLGFHGPAYCVSSACASSSQAIISAAQSVATGQRQIVLTGGTEASITYGSLLSWRRMGVMSDDTCRPFCRTRSGMVLGEGAAMLVLETLESAQARGARILGEISGMAESSDASSMTTPNLDSITRTMHAAVTSAEVTPEEIDYVNAHGTATKMNDKIEAAALASVFGEQVENVVVSSTKALHGHLLGAAGAIEIAACLAALETGIAPPNANHVEDDPDIAVPLAGKTSNHRPVRRAMTTSFAFGGHNTAIILQHAEGTS